MNLKLPPWLINLLRVLISVGLLGWVLSTANGAQLWAVVRAADGRWYALAFGLMLVGVGVRALRWQALLRAVGVRVPWPRLLYLYFVGAFFNTFLPTGFGGDVVRGLELGHGVTAAQAAGTILIDRLTGFIMLFVLAWLALPFAPGLLPLGLSITVALAGVAVLAGSALLFEGRWLKALLAKLPQRFAFASLAWVEHTYHAIAACRAGLPAALGWSLVFNGLLIAAQMLVAQALAVPVAPSVFFLTVPLTAAALLVPLTISGLGVRESLYVLLFGALGVNPALATALSLAVYGMDFALGVVGGAWYAGAALQRLAAKQKHSANPQIKENAEG